MSETVFSKIIDGEIPSYKVYEDDYVYAFLDISQTTKGHTLVIPKKHSQDVFSMTEEDMSHVFSVVPKLANALKATFNCNGMNIVNNNGAVAGQTVFHYHVHLIPRYAEEDGFSTSYTNNMQNYTSETLAELKLQVMKNL